MSPRALVVGGGISGLAAARTLAAAGAEVVLAEAGRLGGKIRTSPFAGRPLDEGADAFLVRVPEAVELCADLGMSPELVHPARGEAFVYTGGALRPVPREQVLGVPADLDALAATGICSGEGLRRARRDLDGSAPAVPLDTDVTVGALVRTRLGDEVHERLVDPLVGGINAGDADRLSLATVAPQLDAAARSREPSLVRACAALRARAVPGPVFAAPIAGMGRLVDALASDLRRRGVEVHEGAEVLGLRRAGSAWAVEAAGTLPIDSAFDAVVLATPAAAAAALLAPVTEAAAGLAAIRSASVALVALAFPRRALDHPLPGSGFLVPRAEGTLLTACSWSSSKWAHLDPDRGDGTVLLRLSAGRDGDRRALDLDDAELTATLLDELGRILHPRDAPVASRVTRWPEAFPQYEAGHPARWAAVRARLAADAPGLALAGPHAAGPGIPTCLRVATGAARSVLHPA